MATDPVTPQPPDEPSQAIPAESVHGSLQDQIDTLSANLQSEMVARQALESRVAALESRFQEQAVPAGGNPFAN